MWTSEESGVVFAEQVEHCVFCRILRGELPYVEIEEMDHTICVIPLDPCAPGHVLYIPKRHVCNGEEEPGVTAQTVLDSMQHPQENMVRAMSLMKDEDAEFLVDGDGIPEFDYNVQFSKGTNATQSIFHLHVHHVPRFPGDELPIMWSGQQKGFYNTRTKKEIRQPEGSVRKVMTKEEQTWRGSGVRDDSTGGVLSVEEFTQGIQSWVAMKWLRDSMTTRCI